jgi:two-component system phosphate regulon response regulator OmpR
MKPSALIVKCKSGRRRALRAGATLRAHTPPRASVACAERSLDLPAYEEAVSAASHAIAADANLPRVLHVDTETGTATVLASLLGSAVHVTHVTTLAAARRLLQSQIYSLVILDPDLPDGDARTLLPLLSGTPLLLYSNQPPLWNDGAPPPFLSKTWTNARQLWTGISTMLWNTSALSAGD